MRVFYLWFFLFGFIPFLQAGGLDYSFQRNRMVDEQIAGRGVKDPLVLEAMKKVKRHLFVPAALVASAYDDRPLPIGHGQTISQPYIVAAMTELIEPKATDVVLEIGTGSGYQAAVLAEIVDRVYTIEIVKELAEESEKRLKALGYAHVHVKEGDGFHGWAEEAPFDAILVTAAPEKVPPPLIEQLKPGGRMVAPVGSQALWQDLLLIEKRKDGSLQQKSVMPVRFVPFISGEK